MVTGQNWKKGQVLSLYPVLNDALMLFAWFLFMSLLYKGQNDKIKCTTKTQATEQPWVQSKRIVCRYPETTTQLCSGTRGATPIWGCQIWIYFGGSDMGWISFPAGSPSAHWNGPSSFLSFLNWSLSLEKGYLFYFILINFSLIYLINLFISYSCILF